MSCLWFLANFSLQGQHSSPYLGKYRSLESFQVSLLFLGSASHLGRLQGLYLKGPLFWQGFKVSGEARV